jgi:hypothetical protein
MEHKIFSNNKLDVNICNSFKKNLIFAPLINRGRVPQNLITRLCL